MASNCSRQAHCLQYAERILEEMNKAAVSLVAVVAALVSAMIQSERIFSGISKYLAPLDNYSDWLYWKETPLFSGTELRLWKLMKGTIDSLSYRGRMAPYIETHEKSKL